MRSLLDRLLDLRPADDAEDRAPPPSVGEGAAVYAIGDIHGCADLFDELLDRIAEDAARRGTGRAAIVVLGDMIDRGPDSAAVLDRLTRPAPAGLDMVVLLGNHERLILDFLADPVGGAAWLGLGGTATIASYGLVPPAGVADPERLADLARDLAAALPPAHRALLESLRPSHRVGDYLFVHAGVRPGVPLEAQRVDDLISIREPFLSSDRRHGAMIVHGHQPEQQPAFRGNRIGIDTGACYWGVLTALVLRGNHRDILQVKKSARRPR